MLGMENRMDNEYRYGIRIVKRDCLSEQFIPVKTFLTHREKELVVERVYVRHHRVIQALAKR